MYPLPNDFVGTCVLSCLTQQLQGAILSLHGCESTWIQTVPVQETLQGETVWEGEVQVFDLHGHPTASRCYAWSHAIDGSECRRFVAVLHERPVDSPEAAGIMKESKE